MPPVTLNLIIANVAVFLLEAAGMPLFEWFALWPPHGSLSQAPDFAPWQLVTYSFLHGGFAHIFFNMFALYMFGSEIERLFGSRFYALYYFAAVVTAAITHLVISAWMGAAPVPMVGASGGIYGLLLAFGIYFPHRRVMLLFPPIPMPAWLFVTLYGLIELYLGVTGSGPGVAHFAHLGGMAAGYALLVFWRRRAGPRQEG
jgi:membrane associated rhomboid family serine protease